MSLHTYALPASWSSEWPSLPPAAADWWLRSEVSPSGCCCWSPGYGRQHGSLPSCRTKKKKTLKHFVLLRVQFLKFMTRRFIISYWSLLNIWQKTLFEITRMAKKNKKSHLGLRIWDKTFVSRTTWREIIAMVKVDSLINIWFKSWW